MTCAAIEIHWRHRRRIRFYYSLVTVVVEILWRVRVVNNFIYLSSPSCASISQAQNSHCSRFTNATISMDFVQQILWRHPTTIDHGPPLTQMRYVWMCCRRHFRWRRGKENYDASLTNCCDCTLGAQRTPTAHQLIFEEVAHRFRVWYQFNRSQLTKRPRNTLLSISVWLSTIVAHNLEMGCRPSTVGRPNRWTSRYFWWCDKSLSNSFLWNQKLPAVELML